MHSYLMVFSEKSVTSGPYSQALIQSPVIKTWFSNYFKFHILLMEINYHLVD